MAFLARLGFFSGIVLMSGFALVILLQIVMGSIPLAGLLETKEAGGSRSFSPARLQLLLFTIAVTAYYLHAVLANPRVDSLPTLPWSVITVLGGSQAAYLGGKAVTTFIQPFLKNLE